MVSKKSPQKGPRGIKGLMDLAVGYQKSMVLLAASSLGIFVVLAREPLVPEEVARQCGTHPRATALLLNACASLGLLSKKGESFANSPLAQRFLVPGEKTHLGNYLGLMEDGYCTWGMLFEAVREGHRESPPERDTGRDPEWNRRFTMAMHEGARSMARQVARLLDLQGRRRLLDVGGGPGTFAVELVARNPALEATIFDLPGVLEITRELLEDSDVADRIRLQPGDYHRDSFGSGNDVVLLFGILHSESLDDRRMLLGKALDALEPGGLVVTRQFLLDEDRAGPVEATLFSLQMLLNTDFGEAYTWDEIRSLLLESGFVDPSRIEISPRRPYWLVSARKP